MTERGVKNIAAWSGCVSGALLEEEYKEKMQEAGFEKVEIRRTKIYEATEAIAAELFPDFSDEERREIDGALASAVIMGKKPPVKRGSY